MPGLSNFVPRLSGQYCKYFQILAFLSLILLVLYFLGHILALLRGKERFTLNQIITTITGSFVLILLYFENTLLYSMCSASL